MTAQAFDTLKVSQALQPVFSKEQAEAIARTFSERATGSLVTTSDLRHEMVHLKIEMVRRIVGAFAFNLLGTVGLMIALAKLVAK